MRFLVAATLSLAAAVPAAAQPARPAAVDYRKDSSWLCLPGRPDICRDSLPTTAVTPKGYGSNGHHFIAENPPIDCFYLYPTASRDAGLNSDLNLSDEAAAAASQFARFASVCRPFAPKYRQMTVGAILAFSAGQDVTGAGMLAYGDVVAAWRDYIRNRNQGRPFVLIGHSQGTLHLIQLIAREIETNPTVAARMKLAVLAGYNVLVPHGKLVGGDFRKTPLCSAPGQTGCVVAWTSYRERNVPPAGAIFGIADRPGMTVACVNPARPGSRNWVELDSYWPANLPYSVPGGRISWSTEGPPPTPWVRTEGLASGRCVNGGPRGYFSVRTNADPNDKRTDRIGGEVGIAGLFIPGWGMHLADISLVQGDLIRLVGEMGAARR